MLLAPFEEKALKKTTHVHMYAACFWRAFYPICTQNQSVILIYISMEMNFEKKVVY